MNGIRATTKAEKYVEKDKEDDDENKNKLQMLWEKIKAERYHEMCGI